MRANNILQFYNGHTDFEGRTYVDYTKMSYDEMESSHNWVQWAFPLMEPSSFQPDIPVLTEFEKRAFMRSEDLVNRHHALVSCYVLFLNGTTHWREPNDHNHLRITRVLKSLCLVGNRPFALKMLQWLTVMANDGEIRVTEKSFKFWMDAVGLGDEHEQNV